MTIDEAITHAREVAKEKYNEGFLCHANPDDGELDGCVKCAQEHEQLAEWLEELQRYRAIGEISTCRNAVEICRAMIERGIEPDNIKEYIAFEDNLVQKGYDLKRLLEMMEEHKRYREIGTVEECLRNKDFLDFLADKMNPNDFETYLRMYNALDEKDKNRKDTKGMLEQEGER